MAEAAEITENTRECGFCLQKDDQLVDPRTLPCSHVCCYRCVVGEFGTNRIARCGKCR